MKIRFAIAPGPAAAQLERFPDFVQGLEALGFDTVWLSDLPLGGVVDPIVGLSFAAACTSKLKLGANVVPIGRHPLTLAKSLAQLDRLSQGRLLLSFVVGIDEPGERRALGVDGADRGRLLEEITVLQRAWWAGDPVEHDGDRYRFAGLGSPGRPFQDPLEIWFGGRGPAALRRVGRFADGWLGAAVTPDEAGGAIRQIEQAAAEADRSIDPEHFGLSLPYSPVEPDAESAARIRSRRTDVDLTQLVAIGPNQLRDLIRRHADAGLSKFVVRAIGSDGDSQAQLEHLAEVLLPLQT